MIFTSSQINSTLLTLFIFCKSSFSFRFFTRFLFLLRFFRGLALILFSRFVYWSSLSFLSWLFIFISYFFLSLFFLWWFLLFLFSFLLFLWLLLFFFLSFFFWFVILLLSLLFNNNIWFVLVNNLRSSLIKIFFHFFDSSESMRNCIFNLFWKFGIGFIIALWFEIWIPTKISTSTRFNNFPQGSSNK